MKFSPSITYIIWNTKLNGGNKIVLRHIVELEKRGFKTSVFSVIPGNLSWFPYQIKKCSFFSLLFKKKDILIATFWPTSYVVLLLSAKKKFYFIQNWEIDFYRNKLLKFFVKFSYLLPLQKITFGSYLKKRLERLFSTEKIYETTNAIDDVFFSLRQKQKRNNNKIVIISVITSYSQYKGIDLLEMTIKKLKKTQDNKYICILVSTEKKSYSDVFDQFFNNQTPQQLAKLYQTADIYINASRTEGFPLPPLEAMANKCIVVATDSGGINEYAVNNHNAIIVKNVRQIWQENILDKIMNNNQLKERLQKNAQITARKYQWKSIIDNLTHIYT